MSIETKTYIPSWLWSELEIFLVYTESKHTETLFVMEKEGYDITKFIKDDMLPVNIVPFDSDIRTKFEEGGKVLSWVALLVKDKHGNRNTVMCVHIAREKSDTIETYGLDRCVTGKYRLRDILRIRDSIQGRRIVFDDTMPVWRGRERFGDIATQPGDFEAGSMLTYFSSFLKNMSRR